MGNGGEGGGPGGGSPAAGEIRLAGQRLYTGQVIHLEVDRVRLSSGAEAVREVVRHSGAAVVVPILEDGRILLVRQFRYPAGEALLELPAGRRLAGEDPADCAARELAEETGLQAGELQYLAGFFTAPGFSDEFLHCYVARRLTPAVGAARDADEDMEVLPVTLEEARHLIRAGHIRDAKTLVGLLLLALNEEDTAASGQAEEPPGAPPAAPSAPLPAHPPGSAAAPCHPRGGAGGEPPQG